MWSATSPAREHSPNMKWGPPDRACSTWIRRFSGRHGVALTLVVAFGWGLLEFAGGHVFWGILFFAMGGAASWQFSIVDWTKYDRPRKEER